MDSDDTMENHNIDEGSSSYQQHNSKYCDVKILQTVLTSDRTNHSYTLIRKISYGHFSTVFLAFDTTDKKYVAVKVCKADPEYESAFVEELDILKDINSKLEQMKLQDNGGIVKMLDFFVYEENTLDDEWEEVKNRHYCFVMELLGHSLLKLLQRYSPHYHHGKAVPIPVVKLLSIQLLTALKNLHLVGWIHSDVKPENISLCYYLPEISESTEYKIEDFIFGRESHYLFDSKLCTSANRIHTDDFHHLSKQDKENVESYLSSQGKKMGIENWYEIQEKVMEFTNYKKEFLKFIQENIASVQSYYQTQGINIFNVLNLIKDAEKMFRISYIPNEEPRVQISSTKIQLQSMKSKLAEYNDEPLFQEYYAYEPLSKDCYSEKQITSPQGLQICLSQTRNANNLSLYIEKLYFDERLPKSIYKLVKSGTHSRFALYSILKQEECEQCQFSSFKSNQQNQLPKYQNKQDMKCFALASDGKALYPILISYFSKQSLIPLCAEMFKAKLLDLGNAYKIEKHGTSIVSTRQYRAPEVILGCPYNEKVDEWSAACVIFEMLTGNYLFAPKHQADEWKRDREHLELIIKVCGSDGLDKLIQLGNPKNVQKIIGSESIKVVERTPISAILVDSFSFEEQIALQIEKFLEPLLMLDFEKRSSCSQALGHAWLESLGDGDYLTGYSGRK